MLLSIEHRHMTSEDVAIWTSHYPDEEENWEEEDIEEAEELEEFSGYCPHCGAEMERLAVSYKNGYEVGDYCCMHCDEETAQRGRVWVYEEGPHMDHIVADMYE